jgi:iron(III) transport system permease protein
MATGLATARRAGDLDLPAKLVLAGGVLIAIYLLAAPLGMLLTAAFRGPADMLPFESGARWTAENFRAIYGEPVLYRQIIPDTLVFVSGAVALTFAIAFTLAWLIERTDLPWRDLWFCLILFPLLVPSVVLAIAWIFLLGPNAGWLNVWVRALLGFEGTGPINIFSMTGLIACQALASVPFAFLLLCSTLRSMNPSFEEASGASGGSPWNTFFRVTLPVLLPGLLAPVILSLLITLEQFEMPLIIGLPARINVFAYRVWFELNPSSGLPNYGGAAAVAIPFLGVGMLLLLVYNWMIRRAESFVTVTGKAYRQTRFALGRWRTPAIVFVLAYVLLAAILPALTLLWTGFFGYALPGLESLQKFSLSAYRYLAGERLFWLGLVNTLLVAGSSALIVTALGCVLAWIIVRTRIAGRRILDFVSFMSVGIPSVIAGLAVMILYLSVPVGIYGTVWILVIAYSYRLAVTTRISRAGLMQIHRELEEASSASGARWLATQWRILLPLMLPSIASGFILLFITGVREFTMGLILYSQDNVVLSVLLWRLYESGQAGPSAALATIIIVLVIPVVFVARRTLAPRIPGG